MPSCSALFCLNQQETGSGRSFHRFPFSRPAILKEWVINMRREDWKPTIRSVICSDHFEESCLERTGQAVFVKKDAVPTIFNFPAYFLKNQKPRKTRGHLKMSSSRGSSLSDASIKDSINNNTPRPTLKRNLNLEEVSNVGNVPKKAKSQELKNTFSSLNDVLNDLRNEHLLSEDSASVLERSFSGVSLETTLLKTKKNGKLARETYPPILKAFALTLQFYSSKAYAYVYNTFDLALPHPDVISRWYSSLNGEPGFTEETFSAMKVKAVEAEIAHKDVICSLIVDEMSTRKCFEWDGNKFCGFSDLGTDSNDDAMPVAVDVLVFMVAALNEEWKVPCGYFMTSGLSSEEKANLIQICLEKLYDAKVKVVSLTCGGPSCSFRLIENLGGNLHIAKPLVPWFLHPSDNTQKVHIFLDVCHMLNLVRNCFASSPFLLDNDNQFIKWSYIVELYEVLQTDSLSGGCKLRSVLGIWSVITKDTLAAQALSSNVADALEFCCCTLKLPQFQGCESTVRFIRIIDSLFHVLNSRNPLAKKFKAPLTQHNEDVWRPILKDSASYLMELKDHRGISVYTTKKKTGFIGLLVNIKSITALFNSFVASAKPALKHLLTNKLSQDHLELLFSAVRAKSIRNQLPTCHQFIDVYKHLIVFQEIDCRSQNCMGQDKTKILHVLTNSFPHKKAASRLDLPLLRRCNLELKAPAEGEHAYRNIPNIKILALYSEECIEYIGRHVVLIVEKLIYCPECVLALHSNFSCELPGELLFPWENLGNTVKVSASVMSICLEAERCIKRILSVTELTIPETKDILPAVSRAVLLEMVHRHDIFVALNEHMFDMSVEANHVIRLIKLVAECYVKIRFHHLAKEYKQLALGKQAKIKLHQLLNFAL